MTRDLCKMKLRLNREPDTVHNGVLNPRRAKSLFPEESRKSVSYLERGDEKKGKSRERGMRGGGGDKSDKSKKNGPRRHSGEQTVER